MWTVVYISQDKMKVDRVLSLLEEKKIMTMTKTSGEDGEETPVAYEILVPKAELETAQEIIFDSEM